MKLWFTLSSGLVVLAACSPGRRGAQESPRGETAGCFAVEQPVRAVKLCLGPPELPSGRYTLDDRLTVPDATLARQCEGRYSSGGGGVTLAPERCSGYTVDQQLGQTGATSPQAAPAVRVRALSPTSLGVVIGPDPELELRRTQ